MVPSDINGWQPADRPSGRRALSRRPAAERQGIPSWCTLNRSDSFPYIYQKTLDISGGGNLGERTDSVKDTLGELGAELDYQLAKDDWTKEPIWKRPVRRDTRIAVAIGAFVAVAMVVGAATLFTHTFPSGVTGARLTTSCTALTMGTA